MVPLRIVDFLVLLLIASFFLIQGGCHTRELQFGISTDIQDSPSSKLFELVEAISHYNNSLFWEIIDQATPTTTLDEILCKLKDEQYWITDADLARFALGIRYYAPDIQKYQELGQRTLSEWDDQVRSQQCSVNRPFVVAQWIGPEDSIGLNIEAIDHYGKGGDPLSLLNGTTSNSFNADSPETDAVKPSREEKMKNIERFNKSLHENKHSMFFCDSARFENFIKLVLNETTAIWTLGNLLPTEHVKGLKKCVLHVTLYGDFTSLEHQAFRTVLKNFDEQQSVATYLRYYPQTKTESLPDGFNPGIPLSGYEVQVQVESEQQLPNWEDLGRKAAYAASQSKDQIKFLRDLTSDLPALVSTLNDLKVPEDFLFGTQYQPGEEHILLNGRSVDIDSLDIRTLFEWVEEEFEIRKQLEVFEIPREIIEPIARFTPPAPKQYRIAIKSSLNIAVHSGSNIESVEEFLSNPSITDRDKTKLSSVTILVNPETPQAKQAFSLLKELEDSNYRVHVLLQPSPRNISQPHNATAQGSDEPVSNVIIGSFFFLLQKQSLQTAKDFLGTLSASDSESGISYEDISIALKKCCETTLETVYEWSLVPHWAVVTNDYILDTGLATSVPGIIVNGVPHGPLDQFSKDLLDTLVEKQSREDFHSLQKQLADGKFTISQAQENAANLWVLTGAEVKEVYSNLVLTDNVQYKPVVSTTFPAGSFDRASEQQRGFGSFLQQQLDFVGDVLNPDAITHFLILDLSTQQALKTLVQLSQRFKPKENTLPEEQILTPEVSGVRYALIHNCICAGTGNVERIVNNTEGHYCSPIFQHLLNIAGRSLANKKYLDFLRLVVPEFVPGVTSKKLDVLKEMETHIQPGINERNQFVSLWKNYLWKDQIQNIHQYVLSEMFPSIKLGYNYIWTNGRLIELPVDLDYFPAAGFELLESLETPTATHIAELLSPVAEKLNLENPELLPEFPRYLSEWIMKASSVVSAHQHPRKTEPLVGFQAPGTHPVEFQLVIDPLGTAARKIAPILDELKQVFGDRISIEVKFNPKDTQSSSPAGRPYVFSRYMLNLHNSNQELLPVNLPIAEDDSLKVTLDYPSVWGDLVSLPPRDSEVDEPLKRGQEFSISADTNSRKAFQFCSSKYPDTFLLTGVGCDSISALPYDAPLLGTSDVGQVIEFLQSLGKESHSHSDNVDILEDPVLLN